jgi:hypothetical protein
VRDRLVTVLGALAALALVYALFGGARSEPPVTRPWSTEGGRNGYLALAHWLQAEGVPTSSLRERMGRLKDAAAVAAPRGNILITTLPYRTALRGDEVAALLSWVGAGNTLLVLAALDDTPEWTAALDTSRFLQTLTVLTTLNFTSSRGDAPRLGTRVPVSAGTPLTLEAVPHPLMTGVATLHGFSDRASEIWTGAPFGPSVVLRLATERSSGSDALWQIPRGAGQVVVAASGSLLSNRNIGDGDARRLVANLLARHLGPDGTVIFDDMHQGLSALYDATALFRDPRLHATLWFLLAAWVAYLVGSWNRLAPPPPAAAAPRQSDFLAAAGGFMARRMAPRDAAALALDGWFDEVRRARGLPCGGPPPWAELEKTPALDRRTLAALRATHAKLAAGRSVDLEDLHNELRQAREAIG